MTIAPKRPLSAAAWSSRSLMLVAALGAVDAVLTSALAPVTTSLAFASPAVYALVAGIHQVLPILAALLLRWWPAIPLTALVTALLAFPINPLGPLLFPALGLPALAIGLTIRLGGCRWASPWLWAVASASGAAVIYLISLPVIDPAVLTPTMLVLILVARLLSAFAATTLAHVLARSLGRAGIRVKN